MIVKLSKVMITLMTIFTVYASDVVGMERLKINAGKDRFKNTGTIYDAQRVKASASNSIARITCTDKYGFLQRYYISAENGSSKVGSVCDKQGGSYDK